METVGNIRFNDERYCVRVKTQWENIISFIGFSNDSSPSYLETCEFILYFTFFVLCFNRNSKLKLKADNEERIIKKYFLN